MKNRHRAVITNESMPPPHFDRSISISSNFPRGDDPPNFIFFRSFNFSQAIVFIKTKTNSISILWKLSQQFHCCAPEMSFFLYSISIFVEWKGFKIDNSEPILTPEMTQLFLSPSYCCCSMLETSALRSDQINRNRKQSTKCACRHRRSGCSTDEWRWDRRADKIRNCCFCRNRMQCSAPSCSRWIWIISFQCARRRFDVYSLNSCRLYSFRWSREQCNAYAFVRRLS